MKVLELFSGTGSVGKVCKERGWEVISLDISRKFDKDITIETDITKWDYKNSIYNPKEFDIIWASPPCATFSCLQRSAKSSKVFKDKFETIEDWRKWNEERIEKDIQEIGLPPLNAALDIIDYFKPKHFFIENPATGRMKEYITDIEYTDADYCMYSNWGYKKKTRFWNNSGCKLNLCNKKCGNMIGNKHSLRIGGRSNTDYVAKLTLKDRYRIPTKLINVLFDQALNIRPFNN